MDATGKESEGSGSKRKLDQPGIVLQGVLSGEDTTVDNQKVQPDLNVAQLSQRGKVHPDIQKHSPVNNHNNSLTLGFSSSHSSPRKSFFGTLSNLLTFKKKSSSAISDEIQSEDDDDDGFVANSGARKRRQGEAFGSRDLLAKSSDRKSSKDEKITDPTGEKDSKIDLRGVASKVTTLQMSIKKWKLQKSSEKPKIKRETIAKSKAHQIFLDETVERMKTELPPPLDAIVHEEAYAIVNKTAAMYKTMLGAKHKLSREAQSHLKFIRASLKEPKM